MNVDDRWGGRPLLQQDALVVGLVQRRRREARAVAGGGVRLRRCLPLSQPPQLLPHLSNRWKTHKLSADTHVASVNTQFVLPQMSH